MVESTKVLGTMIRNQGELMISTRMGTFSLVSMTEDCGMEKVNFNGKVANVMMENGETVRSTGLVYGKGQKETVTLASGSWASLTVMVFIGG